jgi:hypothetical protein
VVRRGERGDPLRPARVFLLVSGRIRVAGVALPRDLDDPVGLKPFQHLCRHHPTRPSPRARPGGQPGGPPSRAQRDRAMTCSSVNAATATTAMVTSAILLTSEPTPGAWLVAANTDANPPTLARIAITRSLTRPVPRPPS